MALCMKNLTVESSVDENSTTASSNESDSPRSSKEDHSNLSLVVKIADTSACKAATGWCRFRGCLDPTVLPFGGMLICCIAFATCFISSDIWFECFCSASIGLVIVLQLFGGAHSRKGKQGPQKIYKESSAKHARCNLTEAQPKCKEAGAHVMPNLRPVKVQPQSDASKSLPPVAPSQQQAQSVRKSLQPSRVPQSRDVVSPPGLAVPTKRECLTAALNKAIQNINVPHRTVSAAPPTKDQRKAEALNAGVVSLPPGLELPLKQKRKIAAATSEGHHVPAPPPGLESSLGLTRPSNGQVVTTKKVGSVAPPPGLARPNAQEFNAASFNRELVAILRDLGTNSNVGAAVLRTRMQNVPLKRQSNVFVDILTRACEETRGLHRRSFLAFAAGLAAADESAFDKMECLVGIQTFFAEVYDSLCDEVTGLQRVIQAEVYPTLRSVYSQEKLDAFVPKSMRP